METPDKIIEFLEEITDYYKSASEIAEADLPTGIWYPPSICIKIDRMRANALLCACEAIELHSYVLDALKEGRLQEAADDDSDDWGDVDDEEFHSAICRIGAED